MALVDGSLKDILGENFISRKGEIRFIPNEPGVRVAGIPGQVVPTSAVSATFESDGDFTADLADTSTFLNDMFYRMQIIWQDEEAGTTLADFPGWQIRVTGPGNIGNMISFGPSPGGGGGANPMIWWVGLTPPPNRNFIWNYLDPEDPDRETGPIPALDLGDILTRWW